MPEPRSLTTWLTGRSIAVSGAHVSKATALWLQTVVALSAGDSVELQEHSRVADGYFAPDHTSLWGAKAA